MDCVEQKLEAALKAYLAANYQGAGEPLNGLAVVLSRTPDLNTADSELVISSYSAGGPHARQGSYEVRVEFAVRTGMEKAAGTETEAGLRGVHGARVEAIRGIFSESRVGEVCAALMAIDAELGVSAYWVEEGGVGMEQSRAETIVGRCFSVCLAEV